MAETVSQLLTCSECLTPFAPASPTQLTCSPECGGSRHAVRKAERQAKRMATLASRTLPCALPGCAGTFVRRHNNHKYCSPACAKRAETARCQVRSHPARPSHPKALSADQLAAVLESLMTRRDLDTWHQEAALCYAAAPDKRIPKLMRAARERMQTL